MFDKFINSLTLIHLFEELLIKKVFKYVSSFVNIDKTFFRLCIAFCKLKPDVKQSLRLAQFFRSLSPLAQRVFGMKSVSLMTGSHKTLISTTNLNKLALADLD